MFEQTYKQPALLEELRRPPLAIEPARITLDDIVVVTKESKLQYDLRKTGLTQGQLMSAYEMQGVNIQRVYESHQRQQESLHNLQRILSPEQLIARNDINWRQVNAAKLVVAFGGDNHFQFVAQFVENAFVLGVNSDPKSSEGALTYYKSDQFEDILQRLMAGDYLIEEWTRLEATDSRGRKLRCSGDLFIGELERPNMSRHILEIDGQTEEQKGSGLLITTGANSTGWYQSESAYAFEDDPTFSKTAQKAAFLLTAPYRGRLVNPKLSHGEIKPGQKLTVTSLNDSQGIIVADSLVRFDLPIGTKITVEISPKPLKVIRFPI